MPIQIALMGRRHFLAATAGALLAACTSAGTGPTAGAGLRPLYARPDRNEWPDEFLQLPEATQAAYRYAVANHDTLQYIPCFCGCVNAGHRSNFDCYVGAVDPDGRIRLDTMSFG